VVAVLRKVMGWGVQSIVEEYNVYAHPKAREVDIAYIQSLDSEELPTFTGLPRPDGLLKASWARAVSRVKMGRMLVAATILILLWAMTATRISVQL
jgi:tyrosine-protein phosphatase SIW14